MRHLILLLALVFIACDEQPTDWQRQIAIDTDGRTSYRVVIIADVTKDNPVVTIPDYATEVLIVREGPGFVRAHMTPDNQNYILLSNQDTLRVRIQ